MKRLIVMLIILIALGAVPSTTSAQTAEDYFKEGDLAFLMYTFDDELDEKEARDALEYAILNFNKAIELNPNYAEAYYLRGCCYSHLAKSPYDKNYRQAIEDLKIAARLGFKKAQDDLRKEGIQW